MSEEKKNEVAVPEVPRKPWYRNRQKGVLSLGRQILFASATWWMNVPLKSITSLPGNAFQPRPLGDNFKPGPLGCAKVIAKFKDNRAVGYAHLSTGTIVRMESKVESKDRRHRNEVANRAPYLRNVRYSLNPKLQTV